ncbi:transglycosylase SLT domain-containing protein [Streptomyces sp. WMMC500]|uniref:golvesin C-terminal-like domain-containing protein n=1 Tax=Streptomyces sp. WMMC500 TaxID=3015154 RepID=UPI00248C899C|nr:transglycosylase SLT domain-containing protein [Streptomyces sp. WMMC500]WBB59048.1 transglycosylase SLT domain-containing protein [Streptomyces sp. WMMC500]
MTHRHGLRRRRLWATGVLALALGAGLIQAPASRAEAPPPSSVEEVWDQLQPAVPAGEPVSAPPAADAVAPGERAEVLGENWKSSGDRAWTTSGDATGFHVLVADSRDGYAWRTAATLSEPGFDTDTWIGNACVTGSGDRAVVVYAPRTFTNDPVLMGRGGFTAVVDLETGKVRKLPVKSSLSYYNPGCGTGDSAVLTQSGGDRDATRLTLVDVPRAAPAEPVEVAGQVTSAVPVDGEVYAAAAGRVVRVAESGRMEAVARTGGVPYRLTPDADGGLAFLDHGGRETARAAHLTAGQLAEGPATPRTLAEGPLNGAGLTRTAAGEVWLTGEIKQVAAGLPDGVRVKAGIPRDAAASTRGAAVVTAVTGADGGQTDGAVADAAAPRPVRIEMTALATGEDVSFSLAPGTVASGEAADAAAAEEPPRTMASRTELIESERTCSVPRNAPRNQAMQPKPRQVEWAVDQAVKGTLNSHISRPANWKNLDMPAYQPQSADMFPRPTLSGGGQIPAQIALGVAMQESNMWQASRYTVPGVTGNPLIGNYYGIDLYDGDSANDWDINWAEADCGYGIMQITDHMRRSGKEDGAPTAWPYQKQRAVALDYTANIAAGLTILAEKWNQTRNAGMTLNNGDPAKLENWFFALWAYNSGFYPESEAGANGGAWGVGWFNNPANPEWDPARDNFMEDRYGNPQHSDAAHPQDWPYPEKVLGFAAQPPEALEAPSTTVPAFRPATWNGTDGDALTPGSAKYHRAGVKPPMTLFCTGANDCDPEAVTSPAGPCGRSDSKCWWNGDATWKDDCAATCGNEFVRFNSSYPEEADGTAYPPNCALDDVPANALLIDNLGENMPSIRPGCEKRWTNAGEFTADFGPGETQNGTQVWPAKTDFHQIGGGFGAGFYFAHGRAPDEKGWRLRVEGTWAFDRGVTGPGLVAVHLPDHGARTEYARYEIETANGTEERIIKQHGEGNRWVLLGAFPFDNKPIVRLDNLVPGGQGEDNVAFDAAMVIPVAGEFVENRVDAAAYFDENQNLDAYPFAEVLATPFADRGELHDWATKRSGDAIGADACSGDPTSSCVGPAMKQAMQSWHNQAEAAGTDPVDHPPGTSIPAWLNFSNPHTQRPDSADKPGWFDLDDGSFKIRSSVTVSYIVLDTGDILQGTERAEFDDRTGDTHLPQFVRDTFAAVEEDYGIEAPNLDFSATDLNEHTGTTTPTDTNRTGVIPGRAYEPAASGPTPITDTGQPASDSVPADCVAVQYTSGGSIGYRIAVSDEALLHQSVGNWASELQFHPNVAPEVWLVASDITNYFFKDTIGALFSHAPPIWQELHFWSCADGSVRKPGDHELLRSSYMPNQYLYVNDRAAGTDGRPSNSAAPVRRGDYYAFTNPLGGDSPYGRCTNTSGHASNPWDIDLLDSPGINPEGGHCTTASYFD